MNQQEFNAETRLFPVGNGNITAKQRPYIVAAAGTSSANKALAYVRSMSMAGLEDKIISWIVDDRNKSTKDRIQALEPTVHTVLPTFMPRSTGFNRNPDGWQLHKSAIISDQDKMVREVQERADQLQEEPQLLLLFGGLAAHTHIGLSLFEKCLKEFPRAIPFLVASIPDDDLVREDSKVLIRSYEPLFAAIERRNGIILLIDESVGGSRDFRMRDSQVGIGLAAIDCAGATENSSLVDVVGSLQRGNRTCWYGLSVSPPRSIATAYSRQHGGHIPINGDQEILLTAATSEAAGIRNRDFCMASHEPVAIDSFKHIAMVMPLLPSLIEEYAPQVKYGFKNLGSELDTRRWDFRLGAANFPKKIQELSDSRNRDVIGTRNDGGSSILSRIAKGIRRRTRLTNAVRPQLFLHTTALYPIPESADGYLAIGSVRKLTGNEPDRPEMAHQDTDSIRNGHDAESEIPIAV